MPAVCKDIPVLTLIPSLEGLREREINRNLLVEVSPDREDLLRNKSISEIRQSLKLRLSSSNGQWLDRVQTRRDTTVKETATTRFSVFDAMASGPFEFVGDGIQKGSNDAGSSNVVRVSPKLSSKSNFIVSTTNGGFLTTWSSQNLSTSDQLVSPRLPGPTHILVIHTTPPTLPCSDINGSQPIHGLKASLTFSEVVEIPINDLLFILNVPNLKLPDNAPAVSVLPRRLHKELPKVLLAVPHLETFPELVIYLHTKNQAALFRAIIPEWMRDLMHPLPKSSPVTREYGVSAGAVTPNVFAKGFQFTAFNVFKIKKLVGKLIAYSTSPCSSSTTSLDTIGLSPTVSTSVNVLTAQGRKAQRSLDSIAAEITQAASEFDTADDPLVSIAVSLNALRDNLNYIGYYASELWDELIAHQRILLSAISLRAKVATN